jgi:hypothetical protein
VPGWRECSGYGGGTVVLAHHLGSQICMTYVAELSPYSYLSGVETENEVNVGWLDRDHDFRRGDVPEVVSARIFVLSNNPVNQTRGWHGCELCPGLNPRHAFHAVRDGIELWLGSAEIRVPSRSGVIYVCPDLIYHYIHDHQYKPPQEFIDAVLEMSQSRSDGM